MASTTFDGPVTSTNGFVGAVDGAVGGTTPAAAVVTTLTASGAAVLSNASIKMTALPVADPSVAGALWCDTTAARVVKVSAG
jgi:hypothetical protein